MDKDSKIYIAGHRGLVGSALLKYLQKDSYTNLVLRSSSEVDLSDQHATELFFREERPEYVFLAAAKVGGIMANNTYRADFILKNLQIQNNIIEMAYKYGVKKLLFLGSSCIYPKDSTIPITEDELLTGELEYTNEPYAIAKIAGLKLIESFNIQYGTNSLAVMPTNLYGENDNYDLEKGHVFPALIRKMHLGKLLKEYDYEAIANNLSLKDASKSSIESALANYGIVKDGDDVKITLWGSGKPYREFMNAHDMAEACVYIMNNVNFSDVATKNEIKNTHINIGTGTDITISDLAHLIAKTVGFTGSIAFDVSKPDGTFRKLLNVDKLHSLGWKHSISLEDGIRDTYNDYLQSTN